MPFGFSLPDSVSNIGWALGFAPIFVPAMVLHKLKKKGCPSVIRYPLAGLTAVAMLPAWLLLILYWIAVALVAIVVIPCMLIFYCCAGIIFFAACMDMEEGDN